MSHFTFVDLFAGIGGFRIALERLGGTGLAYSEISKDAIDVYCSNYNETKDNNLGDITSLQSLPHHDFMTAGVPCQSWSIAGRNLGFDDDRGQLWNDTLYLLNESRPKAFVFENVKGLADPRNRDALSYIMMRIKEAGYFAEAYLLDAQDYGVPQPRVRIYIVGFRAQKHFHRFALPSPSVMKVSLASVLDGNNIKNEVCEERTGSRWSLSCNEQGFNDYFLFNDLRSGATTIHSWDIRETTSRQKYICNLLLANRRKSKYGVLDGNALSLAHIQEIDSTVSHNELEALVGIGILKHYPYAYKITAKAQELSEKERILLAESDGGEVVVDKLKINKELKKQKIKVVELLNSMESRSLAHCTELRYDFKNTKISTGLNGINRIFLPSSKVYPTLVASDTNDFVATEMIKADSPEEWRAKFISEIFTKGKYRKITRAEACRIQGFPDNFILPESRARWMHLIGNSVAVPVIHALASAVIATGVFDESDWEHKEHASQAIPLSLGFYQPQTVQATFDF